MARRPALVEAYSGQNRGAQVARGLHRRRARAVHIGRNFIAEVLPDIAGQGHRLAELVGGGSEATGRVVGRRHGTYQNDRFFGA